MRRRAPLWECVRVGSADGSALYGLNEYNLIKMESAKGLACCQFLGPSR